MSVMTNITFRLRPMWDDEAQLTATSRLVMQSGVISIPFTHTWGNAFAQGYDNDLELKSVVFSEDDVEMSPTRQYLRGGESMNISVAVGFEGVSQPRGFVDGDAELTLYRDGVAVRNTTAVDGAYWNFTENIPFTYGDVEWESWSCLPQRFIGRRAEFHQSGVHGGFRQAKGHGDLDVPLRPSHTESNPSDAGHHLGPTRASQCDDRHGMEGMG